MRNALPLALALGLTVALAPGEAAALYYSDIVGTWCGNEANYTITHHKLVVTWIGDGKKTTFRVTGFQFSDTTLKMKWVNSENKNVETEFGNFSPDRRNMLQFVNNRSFHRC